jgi:hypothetical protein
MSANPQTHALNECSSIMDIKLALDPPVNEACKKGRAAPPEGAARRDRADGLGVPRGRAATVITTYCLGFLAEACH